jgi:hypothetical protein
MISEVWSGLTPDGPAPPFPIEPPMTESTLPSDSTESVEETLSDFLDTALSSAKDQNGPDGEAGGAGRERGEGDAD